MNNNNNNLKKSKIIIDVEAKLSLHCRRSLAAVYDLLPFSYAPCVVFPLFIPTNPRYRANSPLS